MGDRTGDVGLNLHRSLNSLSSSRFIPHFQELHQFVGRVERISVDVPIRGLMYVDVPLIKDTLDEMFEIHVNNEIAAHKDKSESKPSESKPSGCSKKRARDYAIATKSRIKTDMSESCRHGGPLHEAD